MDVFFEPTRGKPFAMEVGFFDTVLEIKEKIQKDQGIPVSKQTLLFNGNVLLDELNVHFSDILDRSKIQLLVTATPDHHHHDSNNNNNNKQLHLIKIEEKSPPPPPQPSSNNNKLHLLLKTPLTSAKSTGHAIEVDADDTVRRLKERIHEIDDGVPVSRLVLRADGYDLRDDHRVLRDYGLSDRSEVEIGVRPSPTNSSSTGSAARNAAGGGGCRKLRVMVLTKCGTRKIPVEVSAADNVGELRKELQKMHQRLHFHLPQEGYFFIYRQNVMDEDRSFRWHHVSQGDTIEIFSGSVTGGS